MISHYVIETVGEGLFRLVMSEEDEPTGARSVVDIIEGDHRYVVNALLAYMAPNENYRLRKG